MADVNLNPPRRPGFDPRLFLRDEELDYGIALILQSQRALNRHLRELTEFLEQPPLAAKILIALRFQPGLTVSALREELGATVPTFARIIGMLGKTGYLDRKRTGKDGRERELALTQLGLRATDPAVIAMRNAMRGAYRKAGSGAVAGTRSVLEALK